MNAEHEHHWQWGTDYGDGTGSHGPCVVEDCQELGATRAPFAANPERREDGSVEAVMTPYYQDGSVTIYHGRCEDVMPSLSEPDLVLADPPYGVNERTQRKKAGRGRSPYALMVARDFPAIDGDDAPYDPTPMLRFRRLVLWGANHYADRLPTSPSWIVWDKLDGLTSKRAFGFNDNGDAELAWTNLGGPVRVIRHRWVGLIRDTEKERHVHPTQKPIAVMSVLIEAYTKPGDLVLAPYMGSGPELVAAKRLGRQAIGIETSEAYCEAAAIRCSQEVLGLPA